jgi:diguanylate cyclase (GGDEF)-like protein/PAS domain S-box-containing protein
MSRWAAGPHALVRVAMYVAFALILLVTAFQTMVVRDQQRQKAVASELIGLAVQQVHASDAMALEAAVFVVQHNPVALTVALEQSQASALRLQARLKDLEAELPADMPALRGAWLKQTERLWAQADSLASLAGPGAGEPGASVQRLREFADETRRAAQDLHWALRSHEELVGKRARDRLQASTALLLMILLACALGVVEPTVRSVRQQHQRLATQALAVQQMAMALSHIDKGVLINDLNNRVTWANEAMVSMTGIPHEELIGQHVMAHAQLAPESLLSWQAGREQRRRGEGFRVELQRIRRDGSRYWVDADVKPWRDAAGQLQGYVSVYADITEQVLQRERLKVLLAALPVGVLVQGANGAVIDCNPAACDIIGLPRERVLALNPGRLATRLRREDGSAWSVESLPPLRTLATGQAGEGEVLGFTDAHGQPRWLFVQTQLLPALQDAPAQVISCFTDITEQKVQQKLLALTVDGSGVGIWQWDIRTNAMSGNPRLTKMLGYSPGDIGMHLRDWVDLVHSEDRDRWMSGVAAHLEDGQVPYAEELRIRCADGRYASVMSYGTVVERDGEGQPTRMAGVHVDVTEQTQMREQLRRSARIDALTNLPNRSVVLERIDQALHRWRGGEGPRFAVLFMDFDRFKQVNDLLGHAAGDELLRQVAKRLQGALRAGDALGRLDDKAVHTAARLGGDEFVVVLEDLKDAQDAERIAGRIGEVLAQPYSLHGMTVHSSASIGIVEAEHAVQDADGVLRDADTAMYEAKRLGKACHVCFQPAMRETAARKNSLEADLRLGLERGELHVVFQPVVGLADGGLMAVEALARWTHPVRGAVSPVEFIPVAEEAGLISAVGDFVMHRACEAFARWQMELGPRAPKLLAVNLSRAQLKQADLVVQVAATLEATGVAPHSVQLEVTESLAAQDEQVQRTLRELKALGVKLALDDFGTGYSSLACLHLLPVDTVKIDRSFVRHAEESEHHRVLIEATIRVARSLGMSTVAEGVETAGQALLLHSMDCDKGQGWLYSKPLEEDKLRRWAMGEEAQSLVA